MKYSFFIVILFVFSFSQAKNFSEDTSGVANEELLKKTCVVTNAVQLKSGKHEAALGDYIKVEISCIDQLIQASQDKKQRIILYFNEVPMHGIYAHFISSKDSSIIFKLTRDTVSLKSWNIFYQGQTLQAKRKVSVSVGFENATSIDTKVKDFELILVRTDLLVFALISLAALLILFIVLVKKTGIIRDDNLIENKGYFSLARTQLAFWSFIVFFSFLYIWIITGEIPPITGSTLILLTISMTTTAGARMIESNEPSEKLKDDISEGFFKDIISDYNGVSIHRFQMVVWTFLLGIFFIRSVVKSLAMPQFDESMLILMGISSGTYLGLKIPEKKAQLEAKETSIPVENISDTSQDEDVPPVG